MTTPAPSRAPTTALPPEKPLTKAWAILARMDGEIQGLAAMLSEAPESRAEDGHELAKVGAVVRLARRYFSVREVEASRAARSVVSAPVGEAEQP